MTCNHELISAFLDGELEPIIVAPVTGHLLKCDSCCRKLSELAQVQSAMRERCLLPDPEGLTRSVMLAITNEKTLGNPGVAAHRVQQGSGSVRAPEMEGPSGPRTRAKE
ncbi:MAG: zf-HC2 domain-containing protein [Magnetococcales bacterium]|nr:zf-HC2 domain-containing protein [Magnetococcales bacterium]